MDSHNTIGHQNTNSTKDSKSYAKKSNFFNKNSAPLTLKEEKLAGEFWETAIDYQNAHKTDVTFKRLKPEQLRGLSEHDSNQHKINYALKAYEQYSQACCKADSHDDVAKRISLRKSMSLALYLADDLYQAQMYALGTMQLVLESFFHAKINGLDGINLINELNLILIKIANKNQALKDPSNPPIIISHTQAYLTKKQLLAKERSYQESIRLFRELSTLVIKDLMSFISDDSCIINEIESRKRLVKTTEVTNSGAWFSSIGSFFNAAWDTREEDTEISPIEQIISDATPYFFRGEYQAFLEHLSREIASETDQAIRLFNYTDSSHFIESTECMLKHGYKPDGIAFLLMMVHQALFNLPSHEKLSTDDLQVKAYDILYYLCEKLPLDIQTKENESTINKIEVLKNLAKVRLIFKYATRDDPILNIKLIQNYFDDLSQSREGMGLFQFWFDNTLIILRDLVMACGANVFDFTEPTLQKEISACRLGSP